MKGIVAIEYNPNLLTRYFTLQREVQTFLSQQSYKLV